MFGPFPITIERLGLGLEDPDAFLRYLGLGTETPEPPNGT